MNSAAKVYHFAILTKLLLTFLALKFNPTNTLLNFYIFSLHYGNHHIHSPPHTLHNVILANLLSVISYYFAAMKMEGARNGSVRIGQVICARTQNWHK
jgi:hypothetical protein